MIKSSSIDERRIASCSKAVCRSIEIGLRIIGCWPNAPYTILKRLFWLVTILTIQAFQYWYFAVRYGSDDLSQLMDGMSVTMAYSLTLVKLISLWVNARILYELLAEMARDWRENGNECDMRTMKSNANISRRCSNALIAVFLISCVLYGTGTILSHRDDEADVPKEREFLFKVEFPFDGKVTPIYELIVLVQILHQASMASIAGMVNALILTLIFHVGGQIDIMCRAITNIPAEEISLSSVRTLIGRHQRIITFSGNIEATFTFITLSQMFSHTIIMCSLGYQIVGSFGTEQGTSTLLKALWFYLIISVESFLICFAGEYLGVKSKAISNAVYESFWYDLEPDQSRVLLFVMMRSQKKLTLTIGKFADLSLERFTAIMKASASYISVLHAMY